MDPNEPLERASHRTLANHDLAREILEWLSFRKLIKMQLINKEWNTRALDFITSWNMLERPFFSREEPHPDLMYLTRARQLRQIISNSDVSIRAVIHQNLSCLQHLEITTSEPEELLPTVLPKLTYLSLCFDAPQAEFASIAAHIAQVCPSLKSLKIRCDLGDASFLQLFTNLQELEVTRVVAPAQLKSIHLPHLKRLTLNVNAMGIHNKITDSNFQECLQAVQFYSPPSFGLNLGLGGLINERAETLLTWALGGSKLDESVLLDLTSPSIAAAQHCCSPLNILRLMNLGADPNVRTFEPYGPTALHLALAYGRTGTVISMIPRKGDCTIRFGRHGMNAYLLAAARLDTNLFFYLCQRETLLENLKKDPNLLRTEDSGYTPTHLIILASRSDQVRAGELGRWLALQQQFENDPSICDEAKYSALESWDSKETPLHVAARTISPMCIKVLLAKHPLMNAFPLNSFGQTPLHLVAVELEKAVGDASRTAAASACFSALCGRLSKLSQQNLFSLGVGFFSSFPKGGSLRASPLVAAARAGLFADLQLILNTGLVTSEAIMKTSNRDGFSPLLVAADHPLYDDAEDTHLKCLELLFSCFDSRDLNVNHIHRLRSTPKLWQHFSLLHVLAKHGSIRAIESLSKKCSIDLNLVSPDEGTPLTCAVKYCQPSKLELAIDWMISHGSKATNSNDPLLILLSREISDGVLLPCAAKLVDLYKRENIDFNGLSRLLLDCSSLSVPIYRFLLSLQPDLCLQDSSREWQTSVEAAVCTLYPPYIIYLIESFKSRGIAVTPFLTDQVWSKLETAVKQQTTNDSDHQRVLHERVSEISRVLLQNGAPACSFPFQQKKFQLLEIL